MNERTFRNRGKVRLIDITMTSEGMLAVNSTVAITDLLSDVAALCRTTSERVCSGSASEVYKALELHRPILSTILDIHRYCRDNFQCVPEATTLFCHLQHYY